MNDKVDRVLKEWDDHLQDILDRYQDDPSKGANEMREALLAQQWLNKISRAMMNGDVRKKPGRKPGPQPKRTVKKRKRRTKAEMEAARAEEAKKVIGKID